MNSKEKGKRGELEVAHLWREYGFDVIRGQQFCGLKGNADVIGVDYIHQEVKRVEKLNIEDAMKQSERDSRKNEIPIVIHRRNNEQWKVTLRARDFIEIWKNIPTKKKLEIASILSMKRQNVVSKEE